jgi:hypothetical protein
MQIGRKSRAVDDKVGTPGFALRRRLRILTERAWHDTVTHYMPEPWLIAQRREHSSLPVRPGRRPQANK